eukprot:1157703-Pelagomonas_calceolata.AAC.9
MLELALLNKAGLRKGEGAHLATPAAETLLQLEGLPSCAFSLMGDWHAHLSCFGNACPVCASSQHPRTCPSIGLLRRSTTYSCVCMSHNNESLCAP